MQRAKKESPLSYIFAIGKIRALERFLIRQEVFEEAIEADLGEALRLFVESDIYSDDILHIKNSQELEVILNRELADLKNQISDLILDKELVSLLDLDGRKCVDYLLKGYRSEFLEDYIRHLVDMYNIKTFLRLNILAEPQGLLEDNLICDGFIKREVFIKSYDKDLAAFMNQLECVHKRSQVIDYTFFLREGIEKVEKESSFVTLEKAMNDFLVSVLKPAKFIAFGPEPVLAYYFAKVNEIDLMRMIILAKLNNVSGDLVKERLNAVYA